MEYKTYNFNSFNLYTIKTNKFKNCHLEVVFRSKITKEKIIPRKFLMELLTYSTKNYNTQKEFTKHLEDLYNASYYGIMSRVGGTLFTNYCLDFLNPKYCDKGYLENILDLVVESLLNPNINEEGFDEETFNIILNNLKNEIKRAKENTRAYAYRELFKQMDKEAYLSYDMIGSLKELNKITPQNLYSLYQTILDNDYCDIYLIGNLDMDEVARYFEKNFTLRMIKTITTPLFVSGKSRNKIQVIKATDNITQAHLLVGCDIIGATDEEQDIIGYLYNFILGSGSLDTKLATYLRQDNSLCYTVNSIYQKYDSAIIIYAGIDDKNYNKAVSLIKKALKEMMTKISSKELENAKKSLTTSLNMIEDNPSSIINNYLFQNIADLKSTAERIELINNVTVSDIKKLAKKVKINTIYLLSGVK